MLAPIHTATSPVAVGHDREVNELKERLRADLTDAMRSRDQVRLRTLRMALTAITNEEVSGDAVHELSDEEIVKVLTREAKKRREGGRPHGFRTRRLGAPPPAIKKEPPALPPGAELRSASRG